MYDIIQDEKIEYTRKDAKVEYDKGNYLLAKTILEALWNNSNKNDVYLLYDYGKVLRKTKDSVVFIEICRGLNGNKKIMSNKFILFILCWCIYDCYVKDYSIKDDKDGFDNFLKRAEFIINNCMQMDANEYFKNPYVLTIRKVVKIYNERASKNYNEIKKWLSYLNPEKLSDETFYFQDKDGKDRELASPKEFYYQHMVKSLEKTGKFEECVDICKKAFNQINKFHYRNDTWIKARMYYSKCMLQGDIEDAIKEYKELAYKENFWFMYHKLSQVCFRYNKITEALLYASKAYDCRFENEKMVNLMFDTGLLWQASGNDVNAEFFFQASAYYRKRQGWSISEELQYVISILEIDVDEKPNINMMKKISKDYIESIEGKTERIEGKVVNILSHGGAGFIMPKQGGSNAYFNMSNVLGKKILSKGDKVEYELIEGKDSKVRAVKIKLRS